MAFPSAPSVLWSVSLLTVLLAAAVHSNYVYDDDPLQPVTSDETVAVGGQVRLTCRVAESDNSSLQWSNTAQQTLYFGEKRALRDNRIQLYRSTSTELSITIDNVQLSDEGDYTCSIFTMPVRTARATVTVLGVPGKPQISGNEEAVQEGGEVTLTCTSTGSKPPAKLRWYQGDRELEGHPVMAESDPGSLTYTVRSQVTLTVSRSDDNALITCAVDHESLASGDVKSSQALRVLFSPEVHIQPQSDLPREGERFHLECLGKGNPEPTSYEWLKTDGELPPLAKVDGAFLRFEMLNKSDNGVYLCNADNGIGQSQGEYKLLVQDPDYVDPFLPSTPEVDSGSGSDPSSPFSPADLPPAPPSGPALRPTDSMAPNAPESTTALSNAPLPRPAARPPRPPPPPPPPPPLPPPPPPPPLPPLLPQFPSG
ncbi:cell adhesion molecule 3 isoform X1 [Myripristis murdjan]|uniref:cell adhesion molecule 3 isoform X1 n=1 Tax=Myripristis murdjan TaxID=586833 RepID=UPI001175E5F8|nr:cell adhesion molecule 3 isoform X1 [Myripristis murdjan]